MSESERLAPPLAVIHAAAKALGGNQPPADRLRTLCDSLKRLLPAAEVRLHVGHRESDYVKVGDTGDGKVSCAIQVAWRPDREAMLEALDSTRPPSELRPILDTVGDLLVAALPAMERGPVEELDLERRLNRLTIDSLPVGLYVVDRDYRIVLWNRKRETGTQGLRRSEVLGKPATEVLTRQAPEALKAEFDQIFQGSESFQTDQPVVTGDDRRIYRITRLPMRLDGDEVSHVITIGEDVTETRAIQRSRQQAEKLAAIGQLAAGVMHEVNNPLATIGACAAAIENRLGKSDTEAQTREYLDIISSEVQRCTGIVNRLLGFARTDRSAADYQPVDLNEVIDRTLYLLKPNTRFQDMHLSRELTEPLPRLLGHAEELQQAIMTILINAADATGGNGHVQIRTAVAGDRVTLELEDDGPGIPPEIAQKIFEPFFTTKGPGRGTGLGLAICYGIVADHGGHLDVEPAATQGSVFRISLPIPAEAAT